MEVKLFSNALITKGVNAINTEINAAQALLEFHKGLKRHGVDKANIKEYRAEFDRVAIAYLDSKHKGFRDWLDGAKDSKGTVESPFVNTKGKAYTKRECGALVRALRKRRVETYEKFLTGESKSTIEKTKYTIFAQDVRAIFPRLEAFQKLKSPTQYEMDHLRLIRGVLEHAIAHDPQAKQEYLAFEKKASKMIK